MIKNKLSISDIFVKKIVEKYKNLPVTHEEIVKIWLRSWGSKNRISYALTLLQNTGEVIRVARGLYFFGDRSGLRQSYWFIVKKLITIHAPSGAWIGGEKALEAHRYNYALPEVLILYTRDTSLRVRLVDGREVHFRTLVSWKKTGKKNLFPWFWKQCQYSDALAGIALPREEIALLEALSLRRHDIGIAEQEILAFLHESHERLDMDVLRDIIVVRYIRAINRLRVIARDNGYTSMYQACLSLIREQGGGCFVSF